MDDNILDLKIMVNGEVYLKGDVVLEMMKGLLEDTCEGYENEAIEKLSYNIDLLLELKEYNDGEY